MLSIMQIGLVDKTGSLKVTGHFFVLVLLICTCSRPVEDTEPVLLELMSSKVTGIDFKNIVKESIEENVFTYTNYYNGGGVAVGDINNDGYVDIYLGANSHSGKLYLNRGGFEFEDITKGSGLDSLSGWKTGVSMVDINQDGYLDLYICRSGRTRPRLRENLLFINNGDLSFSEQGQSYGLNDRSTSLQAAFFDYDLDGDLDMFLLNHAIDPVREIFRNFHDKDISRYSGDKLYQNENGYYNLIEDDIGINRSKLGDGLGVSVADFNNDRYPDLYVANDFVGRDYLYFNKGDGTFRESALESMGHISYSSMGTDAADIDNDGNLDLLVLDMRSTTNFGRKTNMASMNPEAFNLLVELGGHYQYMRNTLHLNNGNESFSDIAPMAGLSSTDWSWAPLFLDLDNDGYKDLLVTNGMRKNTNNKDFIHYKEQRISQELSKSSPDEKALINDILEQIPTEKVVNQVFKNMQGLSFQKYNENWGITVPSYSNGAAYADLDNDGDLDLVVNNIDQEVHIYRNNADRMLSNHYLRISLKGPKQNLNGIGARILVRTGDRYQYLEQQVSRGYQSSVEFTLHLGLGDHRTIDQLLVTWPDGKTNDIRDLESDRIITIDYKEAIFSANENHPPKKLFANVTSDYGVQHAHKENPYNDFEKEVLLPHKMSAFGPALAVGDVNGDGLDDFYIGGSAEYEGSLHLQTEDQRFVEQHQSFMTSDKEHEDVDALFFDADMDNDLDLYIVSGGNEFSEGDQYYQDRLYVNSGDGNFHRVPDALPTIRSSGSVVRAHDFDSDGDLDLFIGGRQDPGKYPRPGKSYLLENVAGKFKDATSKWSEGLSRIGMVTDAAWSDYNNDGLTDLILVGEWMPITIMDNHEGKLSRLEHSHGLEDSQGWWFTLLEADINNDGLPDYLAGNLGRNYKYQASKDAPFQLYSNDFDNDGSLDIVLGYFENDILYPLRGKECSTQQVPLLKSKFKDYNAFGLATLEEVYGNNTLESADLLVANTFDSGIFMNTGDGFNFKPFPQVAQVAAVFGIVYDDFDHDQSKDILIAGNLYSSEIETPRNDAGHGMLLVSDSKGHFNPLRTYDSGLFIPGDLKKLKPIRLGSGTELHKGLVAGINNGTTALIMNQ